MPQPTQVFFDVQFCSHRQDAKIETSWHSGLSPKGNAIEAARAILQQGQSDFPRYAWRIVKWTREIVS